MKKRKARKLARRAERRGISELKMRGQVAECMRVTGGRLTGCAVVPKVESIPTVWTVDDSIGTVEDIRDDGTVMVKIGTGGAT